MGSSEVAMVRDYNTFPAFPLRIILKAASPQTPPLAMKEEQGGVSCHVIARPLVDMFSVSSVQFFNIDTFFLEEITFYFIF